MVHEPVLKTRQVAVGDRLPGRIIVFGRFPAKCTSVNEPARKNKIDDRYRKPRFVLLSDNRDMPGDLATRQFAYASAVQSDHTRCDRDRAVQGTYQSRFSRPIRPQQ